VMDYIENNPRKLVCAQSVSSGEDTPFEDVD